MVVSLNIRRVGSFFQIGARENVWGSKIPSRVGTEKTSHYLPPVGAFLCRVSMGMEGYHSSLTEHKGGTIENGVFLVLHSSSMRYTPRMTEVALC